MDVSLDRSTACNWITARNETSVCKDIYKFLKNTQVDIYTYASVKRLKQIYTYNIDT